MQNRLLQPLLEQQPVGKPSQRVVMRLVGQLVGELALLDRDRGRSAANVKQRKLRLIRPARTLLVNGENAQRLPVTCQNRNGPAGGEPML